MAPWFSASPLWCHLCPQLSFLQLLVRGYSPRHAYKEDASPPWQSWQYQIGVHHSKVKQKQREIKGYQQQRALMKIGEEKSKG